MSIYTACRYTTACPCCGDEISIIVSARGLRLWREGERIQNALPGLTAEEREILISGTCPECWNEIFGKEEEEE